MKTNFLSHISTPIRVLLFGAMVLIGILTTVVAMELANQSADIRNKAATALACTNTLVIQPSGCKRKCAIDQDCMTGTYCYKTTGQTEGLCWNINYTSQTPCTGAAPF
jgi:hypothetical protein